MRHDYSRALPDGTKACARCGVGVRVCRPCDRGHLYCPPCAPVARRGEHAAERGEQPVAALTAQDFVLTDNGAPWATAGMGGITALEAWLLRLPLPLPLEARQVVIQRREIHRGGA